MNPSKKLELGHGGLYTYMSLLCGFFGCLPRSLLAVVAAEDVLLAEDADAPPTYLEGISVTLSCDVASAPSVGTSEKIFGDFALFRITKNCDFRLVL